jgi:3-oxoacyl-[acyl-carrier protein] reductase
MTKNIIITGASRGIGAAIRTRFGSEDARVFAVASKDFDLSSADGAGDLWEAGLAALDRRVDILVNNAGVFEENPLTSEEPDWLSGWERTMQINLTSSALLCRRAVLHWQDRKAEGRIVNIASRAAYRGDSPQHWHYAASKGGMVAMTKSIARAYAAQGPMAANKTRSRVAVSEGKSASLKKGPLEVPPLIKRQGMPVCALFVMGIAF